MTQVVIKIAGDKQEHAYSLTNEKVKYLLKFINSIVEDDESDSLMKDIETGLRQVKKMRSGHLPKRGVKELTHAK
jgi:uncharacterized membrane protein YgaE (UPF0421/DUF939 family)